MTTVTNTVALAISDLESSFEEIRSEKDEKFVVEPNDWLIPIENSHPVLEKRNL